MGVARWEPNLIMVPLLLLATPATTACDHDPLCSYVGCQHRVETEYSRDLTPPYQLEIRSGEIDAEHECPGYLDDYADGNLSWELRCHEGGFSLAGAAVEGSEEVRVTITDLATDVVLVDDMPVNVTADEDHYPNGKACDETPCRRRTAELAIP